MVRHKWGTVDEGRPNKPEVLVSFNKGDEVAISMIARWFGLTVKEFKKLIPSKEKE